MENTISLTAEKLKIHNLTIRSGGTGLNDFIISNSSGTELHVYLLAPVKYYPDKRKSPYRIETACLFNIPDLRVDFNPQLLIFTFQHQQPAHTVFMMIETPDFPVLINNRLRDARADGTYEMMIYELEGDLIYDATGIGGEGEWYFVGGQMGDTIGMDITRFRNRWDKIADFFNHQ